jgi:purine-binding chemotaxis protein CheW
MSSDQQRPGVETVEVVSQDGGLLAFADALLAEGRKQQTPASEETRQYVTFYLRDEEYGVPILQCREIVRFSTITRVPEAPAHVRGVVNLRGHVVPAVDTRTCFGLDPGSPTPRSRLIVVEVAGRLLALVVDRVARILKLAASSIEPPSDAAAARGVTGLARLGDTRIVLMDVARLLRAGPAVAGTSTRGEEA